MKLLALETSSTACSVALCNEGQITSQHKIAPMQHTQLLLPMIDGILSSNNLTLKDLDAIAYGKGPGSFTGMRIASSVTQGLAFSANLPVIPVSSLAAIAQAAHETLKNQAYLVVLDARMGEVYWAYYHVEKNGCAVLQGEERLSKPDEVGRLEGLTNFAAVGDGWTAYQANLIQAFEIEPDLINTTILPTAEAVLKLALANLKKNKAINATEALPSYLIKR